MTSHEGDGNNPVSGRMNDFSHAEVLLLNFKPLFRVISPVFLRDSLQLVTPGFSGLEPRGNNITEKNETSCIDWRMQEGLIQLRKS